MNGRTLKALIFDLDGVLVDTVELHYRAWKQLLDERGIPFPRSDMDRFRGVHQRQMLLTLVGSLTEGQQGAFLARKDRLYRQFLAEAAQTILHAPAVNLLREARASGMKTGLASSSTSARHVLDMVNLSDCFDVIADGNTVFRSKPAPDIFVWVAGALGLHPEEVAVIEDGVAGVEGGVIAGMYVVGVGVEAAAYAPHINLTMDQLNLAAVLAGYEAKSSSRRA